MIHCESCDAIIDENTQNYVILVLNAGQIDGIAGTEAAKSTICYHCAVLYLSRHVISIYNRRLHAVTARRKQLLRERSSMGALSKATGNLFTED